MQNMMVLVKQSRTALIKKDRCSTQVVFGGIKCFFINIPDINEDWREVVDENIILFTF